MDSETGEILQLLLPGPNAGVTGLFWIEGTLWVANGVGEHGFPCTCTRLRI